VDSSILVVDEQLPGDPGGVVVGHEDGKEGDHGEKGVKVEHAFSQTKINLLRSFFPGKNLFKHCFIATSPFS
jgi:hypothetical protein